MYDRLQLTNMLRSEVERIPETGLPLEVFPARIRVLILNLARYENFNVEYTALILLSAVATAIGNYCRIRIKGEWKTSPSIYMMLVGRLGLGKTPLLGFLYKPIREHDDRTYEKYNEVWPAVEGDLQVGSSANPYQESVHQRHRFGVGQSAAGDLPGRIHGKRTARPLSVRLSERPEDFWQETQRRHHCATGSGRTVAGDVEQDSEPPVSGGCCAEYGRRGGGMQCVDIESVQAAIRMIGYYEETYRRIQELIVASNIGESKEARLSLLGDTFTAGDAIVAGKRVELSRCSAYYALK